MLVYIILLFLVFAPFAYADTLYLPENILFDNPNNYGLFIRDNAESVQLVRLSSDSIISVPDSLFLNVGENHAIFDVNILDVGESKVMAYTDGNFYEASTIISDSINNDYTISLILPNSTVTSEIIGIVYLTDKFERPIFSTKDIKINFVTTNAQLANDTITITANNSHAFFSVSIYGDATISAYTESSISKTSLINFKNSEIQVNMGIAPHIIAENSFAYLFVWFTDIHGTPFVPHFPITATIHTTDDNILGFDASATEFEKIYIANGLYNGRIDTYNSGVVTVTVNAPGYGSALQTVTVGVTDTNSTSINHLPNYVKTAIYPTETLSDAWLVWSLYYSPNANSTDTLYPVYGDNYDFFITSNSVSHDTSHTFESANRYTQSNIIPLYSDILGEHELSVVSSNFEVSDSAAFSIVNAIHYQLSITPLPFVPGIRDSLFTITILDPDGFVIDPHYIFGDLPVRLISDDIQFENDLVTLREPITIIHGTSQIKFPSITVISDESYVESTFGGSKKISISIQVPEMVHLGEKFPAYAYLMDENQSPITILNDYLEIQGCDTKDKQLFSCDYSTEFLIFDNDVGFASKEITVFRNEMNPSDVYISDITDEIDLDDTITLTIHKPNDYSFKVITNVNHKILGDEIIINPEFPGEYTLDVIISSRGYQSVTESITFTVTDYISPSITTQSNGVLFPADITVTSDGVVTSVTTPSDLRIKQGYVTINFPRQVDADLGYVFEKITLNGEVYVDNVFDGILVPFDSIIADYKTVVNIHVNDGAGSGVYDFGDTVILSAPSKDVVWFLIQDVFDYWEYLPNGDVYSESVVFVAENSFETSAIYKKSHNGLIVIVISMMILLFAVKYKKQILEKIPLRSEDSS